jgi:hypothetical protein
MIVPNPLNGLVNPRRKVPRPRWMCQHPDAVLVNRDSFHYRCAICNPSMGIITVICSRQRSPKTVQISPGPSSPVGFGPG